MNIYEERIDFPHYEYSVAEVFNDFPNYFNTVHGDKSDLISVQLIKENEYIFWYKLKE